MMRGATEFVEGVVEREAARLRERCAALEEALRPLVDAYPGAAQLQQEVAPALERDRRFAQCLERTDWTEALKELDQKLEAMGASGGVSGPIQWLWRGDEGTFRRHDEEGEPRSKRSQALAVAAVVEGAVGAVVEPDGVSYPIIFTHQAQRNHRAVQAAIGWALAAAVLDARDGLRGAVLQAGSVIVEVGEAGKRPAEIPEATAFGFVERGELWRRIEAFDEVDPQAHWEKWRRAVGGAGPTVWELRDHRGAWVTVAIDPAMRRLRVSTREASRAVRKRHHVFVDDAPRRHRDHFFGGVDALEEATGQALRATIDQGFRVVACEGDGAPR